MSKVSYGVGVRHIKVWSPIPWLSTHVEGWLFTWLFFAVYKIDHTKMAALIESINTNDT